MWTGQNFFYKKKTQICISQPDICMHTRPNSQSLKKFMEIDANVLNMEANQRRQTIT